MYPAARLQLDDDMTTIEIDTPDGPIDALLSLPPGHGPWPGVVVIHDAFGYGRDKQSTNDRIAAGGLSWRSPRTCMRGVAASAASPGSCGSC